MAEALTTYDHAAQRRAAAADAAEVLRVQDDLIADLDEMGQRATDFESELSIWRNMALSAMKEREDDLVNFLLKAQQELAYVQALKGVIATLPENRKDADFTDNIGYLDEYEAALRSAVNLGQGVLSDEAVVAVRNNLPETQYPDLESVNTELGGLMDRLNNGGTDYTSQVEERGGIVSIIISHKQEEIATIKIPLNSKAPAELIIAEKTTQYSEGDIFGAMELKILAETP